MSPLRKAHIQRCCCIIWWSLVIHWNAHCCNAFLVTQSSSRWNDQQRQFDSFAITSKRYESALSLLETDVVSSSSSSSSSLLFASGPSFSSSSLSTADAIHVLEDCSDDVINTVAKFLIDAYWLSTPRLWTDPTIQLNDISVPQQQMIITTLQREAADYLRTQYGERMGKRLLKTCIVAAEGDGTTNFETSDNVDDSTNSSTLIAGLLCMHELVYKDNNILNDDESTSLLQSTVAILGPKERRLYKDATTIDIVNKLVTPSSSSSSTTTKAVCVFSNLAVSESYRRRGIAKQLCLAAEQVAMEWGYTELYLKVEAQNSAAVQLYQNKLGYSVDQHLLGDPAIRLDLMNAAFIDDEVETLILCKQLK